MVYQKLRSWPLVQNQPLDGKLPQQFELVWSHPFPAFSSSGKLAVTTDFARGSGISILRSDGSVERLLSDPNATGEALSPTWSRDEQWIAYGQGGFFRGAAAQARIIMARTDGSGERKVLETGAGNAGFPSFSPDGQRLVFRYRGATEQGLRTLSLIDGRLQTLTAERDDIPAWSPDGERIAFTRAIGDGFDIFTIRPDGSGLQRLTNSPGLNAHATWSPDGRHLLFASGRLGFKDEQALYYDWTTQAYTELFVMDVDGGNQRALTDNKWEDGTATWAPAP
jgi:Tol biopolymer transport system component